MFCVKRKKVLYLTFFYTFAFFSGHSFGLSHLSLKKDLKIGKEKGGNTGICSVKEGRKAKNTIGAIRKYGILKSSEK